LQVGDVDEGFKEQRLAAALNARDAFEHGKL
jgi:hypothetical protein